MRVLGLCVACIPSFFRNILVQNMTLYTISAISHGGNFLNGSMFDIALNLYLICSNVPLYLWDMFTSECDI